MSLPGALGGTASHIPHAGGYLSAESSKVTAWQRVVSERSVNVGLAWFGSEHHINDHNRSMDLSQILPITRLGLDIDWHSLHVDDRATDVQALRDASWIRKHTEALTDFSQTAALVQCLDLIITVDTAVAHLAGALGKPVWILLPFVPDYRWLMNRSDSPWYDSARLFRQPSPGDWNSVLREVSSALEESFSNNLLEYPHYTRPQTWEDIQGNKHEVPDVLTSGHHEKIDKWRKEKSVEKTKELRPDLYKKEI